MEIYFIDGCKHNQHPNQPCMNDPNYYPQFQTNLNAFKTLIINLVNTNSSSTFLHFGDGDYYFLKCIELGSAKPGKRALSVPYNQINIQKFRDGLPQNDYICVEIFEPSNIEKFISLYPNITPAFPTEYLYGLTANNWFTSTFKGQIGLIGAGEKLDMIIDLLQYEEYQKYLGLTEFTDYIKLPQKFACDNLLHTIEIVSQQLTKSSTHTKIFLCGMGHVKSGLLHELKKIKPAIYIDVGCGIDALAGIIDPDRPYMKSRINYQIKKHIPNIDLLQFDNHSNVKFLN